MSDSPFVALAMGWIKPNIVKIIETIDQHEDLYSAARMGKDIVPSISTKYMNELSQLPDSYIRMVKSFPADTAMSIAKNVVARAVKEMAESDGETDVVRTAREHPEWLESQANRLCNLAILRISKM